MAVKTMPQKRFKYIIKDDITSVETELDIDPKGWDGHEVGFERSEDFGLNIQNVVPLSFSGAGRTILKGVYESKGIFGRTRTLIEKRQNDWTYAPFYAYKHDYSTYKDNLRYIEIAGIEDGLAKKFDTYKDTEYEIDIPSTNKVFIDYSGAKYTTTNQIQAGAGSIQEFQKKDIVAGDDAYALRGTRAVRAYNNKVAFTDSEGLPYETMTFRALYSTSIDIVINKNCTIEADAIFTEATPASGTLQLIEHDENFANPTIPSKKTYTAASSTTPANNRIDVFEGVDSFSLALQAGKLYTLFYIADEKSYDDINVLEAAGCYIDISNVVDSAYQNAKLEAFTYEWLIEQLLLKIDSTATLNPTVAYPNVTEYLTATPCIRNMGNYNGTGKIKTTLKDVLESFNKLKCIAIDITGNVMTISNRLPVVVGLSTIQSAVYPTASSYGLITVNNIVVEHSTEHQYNKITVGADTDDREDDDPLVYPFICKKEFSVEDTIAENELDLVNNFMLDPYAIDKYIINTLETTDNKDECKVCVFACNAVSSDYYVFGYDKTESFILTDDFQECRAISRDIHVKTDATVKFSVFSTSTETADVIIETEVIITEYNNTIVYDETFPNIIEETDLDVEVPSGYYYITLITRAKQGIIFDPPISITITSNINGVIGTSPSMLEILYNTPYAAIYRGHDKPIIGFSGDSDTIYNIPLTPKRILNNWINYLAISVVGKDTKALKYGTATILNSAIESKCDYESSSVVENADLSLTGVTPLFLPSTISADTDKAILDIDTFEEDKYKYFSLKDEKTNKTYQGWINSVTFALARNKGKQIMLQAKSI